MACLPHHGSIIYGLTYAVSKMTGTSLLRNAINMTRASVS